jgi:hypothetical protein
MKLMKLCRWNNTMITLREWKDYYNRIEALELLPKKVFILLATEWANNVLPIYEKQYPNDNRPRLAIEASYNYIFQVVEYWDAKLYIMF